MPEPFEDNPYLDDAFRTRKRVFQSQRWFLQRLNAAHHVAKQLLREDCAVIQDHSIYDVHHVFNRVMLDIGWLTSVDYCELGNIYRRYEPGLVKPDIVVVLGGSLGSLAQRIARRARTFERTIDAEILQRFTLASEEWWASKNTWLALKVDSDEVDCRTDAGIQHVHSVIRSGLEV